jgi:subtilisin family serine protease
LVNSIVEAISVIPDSAYGDDGYFYEGYQGAQDYEGHGSHICGMLVGQTEDMTLGIAPQAGIISIKALEKYGSSAAGTTEWLIRAILYAISRDVDIINLSVGGSKSYVSAAQVAFQQAADAGILVVCATGNSSTGPSGSIDYPAAYDNTLAITSVTVDESGILLSDFSKYGPGTDLSAPGVAIYSCDENGQYQSLSGTSMSCAVVTGVAALLLSQDPDLSPSELIQLMEQSATDAGTVGYDTQFGWGVVNAEAAILQLQQDSATDSSDQAPQEDTVPPPTVPNGPETAAENDWLTTQENNVQTQSAAQNTLELQESQPIHHLIYISIGVCLAGAILFVLLRARNRKQNLKQG